MFITCYNLFVMIDKIWYIYIYKYESFGGGGMFLNIKYDNDFNSVYAHAE